jgi:hypothetical protein
MLPRVSTGPTFPYLGSPNGVQVWAGNFTQRIIQEFSHHATRLNQCLPEDGSEAMIGTLTGPSITLTGSTSGTTVLQATAIASGTLTLPAATDQLVGRATTDTLTNKTIASSTDVIGGVTMTLGSDATGDIYYRNSSGVLTRLGIGSSSQFLGGGTVPAWGTPATGPTPAMVLLNTITATGSPTTLNDITSLTASYSAYEIVWYDLVTNTNSESLLFQVYSSGYKSSGYVGGCILSSSNSPAAETSSAGIMLSATAALYNGAPGSSGRLRVFNPSASAICSIKGEFNSPATSSATFIGTTGGYWNTSGVITGFQITAGGTATFTSGTVKVYGIS